MSRVEQQPHSPAILIVDDNSTNVKVVMQYLAEYGFQIMVARTGEAGLEIAQHDQPDLILLDLMLPGIDGFEVCRRLKADTRTCEIPVIFMTSVTRVEDKVKGFEVGGVDYIAKPFQEQEVLARVATHLRLQNLTRELREARDTLEDRVAARTAELARANQELQIEIAGRKRIEEELKKHRAHLEDLVGERTAELILAKEKALEAQRAAEVANQAKSAFLSTMSHELRTPLNGILGYAQILKRGQELNALQRDGLDIIEQSGQHLLTLINDILDLAKIEAGKLELAPADLYLPGFLNGITGIIRMRTEQKNLRFTFEASPSLPTGIRADEKRLRQVLLNLLGNAVKFTDKGQVRLRVSVVSSPLSVVSGPLPKEEAGITSNQQRTTNNGPRTTNNEQQMIRFEIEDTGPGIAPTELERIFLPFEQVGDIRQRAAGTGLGLAISQRLVELMGSEIKVESPPLIPPTGGERPPSLPPTGGEREARGGPGSRFWFELTLPVTAAAAPAEAAQKRIIAGYQGPRRTALVTDDKAYNRSVMLRLLEPLGFEIVEAADGREAVAKAGQSRPALILMDMVMPVMTGFEAVREIRKIPEAAGALIIAVTASVFEMDREQCQLAGCDAFLPKPVDMDRLLALLETHLPWEWIYEEASALALPALPPDPAAPLVPPPPGELEILFELATMGNIRRIRERADHIEQMDEKFRPFADKLRALARDFDNEQILALVKPYLEAEL